MPLGPEGEPVLGVFSWAWSWTTIKIPLRNFDFLRGRDYYYLIVAEGRDGHARLGDPGILGRTGRTSKKE
jgi:hypothetical protein